MNQRERGKQERRERILDAAEAMIRARGARDVAMRALAERAGLSLATPFNLFGSKSAVLAALLERSVDTQFERLTAARELAPLDRVFALGDRGVRAYADDAALYRPLLQALFQAQAVPQLVQRCTELWGEALHDAVGAGWIDPALDTELLARQLHLEYRGSLSLWLEEEIDGRGWQWQLRYGVASVLCGAVVGAARARVREHLLEAQAALAAAVADRRDSRRKPPARRRKSLA